MSDIAFALSMVITGQVLLHVMVAARGNSIIPWFNTSVSHQSYIIDFFFQQPSLIEPLIFHGPSLKVTTCNQEHVLSVHVYMPHIRNYVRATWQIQIADQGRGDKNASFTSETPKRAYNVAARPPNFQARIEYMLNFAVFVIRFSLSPSLFSRIWISTGHHDPVPPIHLGPITSHM